MVNLAARPAPQVTQALLDYLVGATPRITDLTPGSVLRSLVESVALELARLEYAIAVAKNEAIEGASYTTFGFALEGAEPATGDVVATLAPGFRGTVSVPQGTRVSVPGVPAKSYQTRQALSVTLLGQPSDPSTLTLPIEALAPGAAGNTVAGTVTQLGAAIAGIDAISNPLAIWNGQDPETLAARRERFKQFIISIQRSTRDAVLAGARSTRLLDDYGYVVDQVRKASTVEHDPLRPDTTQGNPDNPPPGEIWVFIANGVGPTDPVLVSACNTILHGYEDTSTTPATIVPGFKAAAITCKVFPAVQVVIPVTVRYDLAPGYLPQTVEPGIRLAIAGYFNTLDVGLPLRVQMLERAIAVVAGVLDFALDSPTANYAAAYKELCVPQIQIVPPVLGA